jgi:serine/threonine protein kinase
MIYGFHPFIKDNPVTSIQEIADLIENTELTFPEDVVLKNKDFIALLTKMLVEKEDDRFSWMDVFDYPLFTNIEIEHKNSKMTLIKKKIQ